MPYRLQYDCKCIFCSFIQTEGRAKIFSVVIGNISQMFPLSLSYMETRTFWWCTCIGSIIMGLCLNLPLMLLEKTGKLAVLGIQLDNSNTVLDFLSWERAKVKEREKKIDSYVTTGADLSTPVLLLLKCLDHFKPRAKVRQNLMKSFFNYRHFYVPAIDLYLYRIFVDFLCRKD